MFKTKLKNTQMQNLLIDILAANSQPQAAQTQSATYSRKLGPSSSSSYSSSPSYSSSFSSSVKDKKKKVFYSKWKLFWEWFCFVGHPK